MDSLKNRVIALGSLRVALLASGMWVVAANPAAAQTVPPRTDRPERGRPGDRLPADSARASDERPGDIVVTAQRRTERAQDVPVAVSVVSGKELLDRSLHDVQQLQYAVPSLQANARSSAPGVGDYFIRGVGTAVFSNSIEYDVSTVIDDVVLARPELGSLQFFDVDRIEVLRGPQATLFGKNASAGVVNITTSRPKIGKAEGGVNLELAGMTTPGTGVNGRAEAYVNLPVATDSALRISAFGTYESPLVRNVNPANQSDFAFREGGGKIKYLWQPTDRFHLYLIADYAAERGVSSGAFTLRKTGVSAPLPPVLAAANAALGIVPGPDNLENGSNAPYQSSFQVGGAQLELGYDLGGGYSISNILAWRFYNLKAVADSDYTSASYFDTVSTPLRDRQLTDEIRFSSPSGGVVEGQGGVFLYSGTFHRDSTAAASLGMTLPSGVSARGGSTFSVQHAKSAAAFAQFTIRPVAKVRIIAGGRFTYDNISLDVRSFQGSALVPFFPVGTLNQSRDQTNFSYKLGAQYDFTRAVMGYVTYTRGYKGPAFNNTTSTIAAVAVDREIPEAWEAGLKSSLANGNITLNLAVFSELFHDYQATSLDATIGQVVLQNAGEAQSKGVEAEFTARAGHLTLSGGLAYVDAKFTKFPNAPCYAGQTVAQGCIILRPAAPGVPALTAYNAAGNPLVQAPKFTANASVRYQRPLSSRIDGFIGLSGYYRTDSNFSVNKDPNTALPAYGRLDGEIGVTSSDGRWRAAVFGKNLTDKRVPSYLQSSAGTPGSYQQSFSSSSFRTIGLNLTYRY